MTASYTKTLNNTRPSNKGRNHPVTSLAMAIFEEYLDNEIEPLKMQLRKKYERRENLYQSDIIDLPEKEQKHFNYLTKEIEDTYQALIAIRQAKEEYLSEYGKLLDKYLSVKTFTDHQFQRADFWFKKWEQVSIKLGKAMDLLSCLSGEELTELKDRRDDKQISEMLKAFEI